MKKLAVYYDNPKQGILPAFFSECLDITDPVFTFNRCMEEIDLRKYLSKLPAYDCRIRYNPVKCVENGSVRFMDEIIKGTGQVFKNTLFETYFPHAKKDRRLILSNGLIQ